jgi:hypothetical protein
MSNVLDLVDQTVFLGERATGATSLLQCVWVYDRGIDLDGLRRFHHHLQRGRLSRRIERSPLPFGRHRWVSPERSSDLEIASPRARSGFDAWLDEQANTPVDAERGPGWHLAALPFTDGGAGISLVTSHCLADGLGLCEALADAASGRDDAIDWPAAAARRRWPALREDARQAARDVPAAGGAVVAVARMAGQNRGGAPSAPARRLPRGTDRGITLPMATLFVDADEWDARAASLGGTSNALLAGLAARLAQRVGRLAADGSVDLAMPVNERTPGDTRANAVTNVDILVDPVPATGDLRGIRSAIKRALIRHREVPDERWALLPIIPLLPNRVFRRMVSVAAGRATSVISSNLGAINPDANRPDGTDADYFAMKSLYPGVTDATMHRVGGVLALLSGRLGGRVFVSVLAYQPGGPNDMWSQAISTTLTDFSLAYTTGWRAASPTTQGV